MSRPSQANSLLESQIRRTVQFILRNEFEIQPQATRIQFRDQHIELLLVQRSGNDKWLAVQ